MRQIIFQNVPLVKASFFQKLFKQLPTENGVIELNNLLALYPVKEISKMQIYEIEQYYQITLEQEFKLNLEEFYAVYLNYCLIEGNLKDEDFENLNHLKSILSLNDSTIEKLHHKIGTIVYKKFFEKAIVNGRLIRKEEDFLEKIEKDLHLPRQLVEKISSETKNTFIQNYIRNVIKSQELSPNIENEISNIAESLNIDLEFDKKTKKQLEKLKLYWDLENLSLSTINPDIVIQKSEQCYFKIESVNWYELRSVRQKPSHYNSNLKILKEFYLNSESYKSMNNSVNYMKYIDTGNIYLTNKRIIFAGSSKNINIRFEKILRLTPKSDGIEIDKETGKAAIIQLPDRIDEFCITLDRLIRERD
jgi:hypothetical protein